MKAWKIITMVLVVCMVVVLFTGCLEREFPKSETETRSELQEEVEFIVKVLNERYEPVMNAEVEFFLTRNTTIKKGFTDEEGQAVFKIPAGTYFVETKAEGYYTNLFSSVKVPESSPLNILLTPLLHKPRSSEIDTVEIVDIKAERWYASAIILNVTFYNYGNTRGIVSCVATAKWNYPERHINFGKKIVEESSEDAFYLEPNQTILKNILISSGVSPLADKPFYWNVEIVK